MKIRTWIKYTESYLPTKRHRKLRYRECEDFVNIELKEVDFNSLIPALSVGNKKYYLFEGGLYIKAKIRDVSAYNKIKNPLQNLIHCNEKGSRYFGFRETDTREKMIDRANQDMERYLLVDNDLYVQADEPVYAIYCFGCGNNHAETILSVTSGNVARQNSGSYFNANDRKEAIDYAIKVAMNRGDTNSIEDIKNVEAIKILNYQVKFATNLNN